MFEAKPNQVKHVLPPLDLFECAKPANPLARNSEAGGVILLQLRKEEAPRWNVEDFGNCLDVLHCIGGLQHMGEED
uniref:Uncharacterized protein n=1 Tax=Chromera velia CCMP2878 TaxID=1169474 RepID=A0A0G4FQN5_9ALVE|eukprot:Cvel_18254.t1-p1 / transcript=Cvel_18254.t1 / gene=Cvel_18254 / organism=Chromera_velia_CCMP2878 / gene_product=hypothetical protein / transcript_product=hypothetical protein / location=Cvel_scaffold1502:14922-15146(+) / protein_length=75 / sequence_SO=supercontig / SO=protein_coding / is_pseudo=false